MTKIETRHLLLGAGLSLAAVASAHPLQNGDFETVTLTPNDGSGSGYWIFNNGRTNLDSWTIGGRAGDVGIDVVTNPYNHDGIFGVDLAGTPGPGSINQTIDTVSGQQYATSFWAMYAGDPPFRP